MAAQLTLEERRQKMLKDAQVPLGAKMLVGGTAGVFGTLCIFPIDFIKTHKQALPANTSATSIVRSAIASGGVRGLYRGLVPNCVGVFPEKALKLGVNDKLRDWLTEGRIDQITLGQQIIAGALTTLSTALVTNPMEIVKLRMQLAAEVAKKAGLPKPTASAMHYVRELGFFGLFKATHSTLARDIPYNVIFFPTYHYSKQFWSGGEPLPSTPVMFLSGATAGAVAAVICTPFDLIKTRIQAADSQYAGWVDCLRRTLANPNEGWRALFKGATFRAGVQAPLYGIALLSFELQKRWIVDQSLKKGH